jgi:hypothetical protein
MDEFGQRFTAERELLTVRNIFIYNVFGLTLRYRVGCVSLVWLWIMAGNEQSDKK